jgi:predicted P-loop ATPase
MTTRGDKPSTGEPTPDELFPDLDRRRLEPFLVASGIKLDLRMVRPTLACFAKDCPGPATLNRDTDTIGCTACGLEFDVFDVVARLHGEIDEVKARAIISRVCSGEKVKKKKEKIVRAKVGDWTDFLEMNAEGVPKSSDGNLYQIFLNDPAWKGALGWNQRSLEVVALRDTPIGLKAGGVLLDHHASQAAAWLYSQWGMPGPSRSAVLVEFCSAAREYTFDPVRDWLETLKWDGVKRTNRWLWEAGGCPVNDYTIAVAEKFLIGAAARALRYGCKLDTVPVFCGPQGALKSTMLKTLVPDPAWFDDSFSPSEIGDKDSLLQIHGPWIIEIQELDGLGKRETSQVKAFISRASDRFRQPYGRVTERHDRGCVFAGTVNPDAFLVDTTGNRRYWPVAFKRGNIKWLEDNRDQLWAEAVSQFRSGVQWWLTDDLERMASAEQEAHRQEDPWEERVRKWIDEHPGKPVCQGLLLQVLVSGADKEDPKQGSRVARILQILQREGWTREENRRRIDERNAFWIVPPTSAANGNDNTEPTEREETQGRLDRDARWEGR